MGLANIEKNPVYRLTLNFYGAIEDFGLELSPQEKGKFVGMLAELYNSTGEIPSKGAIKILLELDFEGRTAACAVERSYGER
jgi:hypothetical protein